MFAVIRTEVCAAEQFFHRLLGLLDPYRRIYAQPVKRFGTRILECVVEFPLGIRPEKAERAVSYALRAIAESGIRTIIPSKEFAYSALLQDVSLTLPDRTRLLRKSAGKMALAAMGSDSRYKTAALYAKRLTQEFDDAVRILLPRTRNLAIRCPYQQETYTRGLMQEFGISVLTTTHAFQSADLHLFFDPPENIPMPKPEATAILFTEEPIKLPCRVVRDAEFAWPSALESQQEYPDQDLLAALYECGAVNEQDLEVKHLVSDKCAETVTVKLWEEFPASIDNGIRNQYNVF